MKLVTLLSVSVLLTACFGGATKPVTVAQYDLGDLASAGSSGGMTLGQATLPLRSVDVHAPSWLSKATIQYRLAYADAGRRDVYTESRWAAAPGELLEVSLRRRLGLVDGAADSAGSGAGCRLRVELDEFVQVFDSAQQSRAVIAARLMVQAPRSDELLVRKTLQLSKPASSPDARGGVAAFSSLATEMGNEAGHWLAALARDQPALIKRCRTN
jgi:cholesterol transport system auxiliary component